MKLDFPAFAFIMTLAAVSVWLLLVIFVAAFAMRLGEVAETVESGA